MAYTAKTWETGEVISATDLNHLEAGAQANANDIATIQNALPTYVGANVTKKAAATYTPGTANQTIAAGQYLNGTQTIKGDANLVPGNIKSGTAIFGVTGSYEGSGSGGLDTSDATAAADNIEEGYTAYVDGELVTGTLPHTARSIAVSPEVSDGWLNLNYPYASPKWIIGGGPGFTLCTKLTNLGDATAEDVAAGKTFTSAAGLKVTGTATGSSGGSLTTVTGTTTSATIETGLSSIKCIVIYKSSVTKAGLVQGVYMVDSNEGYYVYCSSYSTYLKVYSTGVDTASTVNGGTFTWGGSDTAGLTSDVTYNWTAVGEA